jgi:hypothetical protein
MVESTAQSLKTNEEIPVKNIFVLSVFVLSGSTVPGLRNPISWSLLLRTSAREITTRTVRIETASPSGEGIQCNSSNRYPRLP